MGIFAGCRFSKPSVRMEARLRAARFFGVWQGSSPVMTSASNASCSQGSNGRGQPPEWPPPLAAEMRPQESLATDTSRNREITGLQDLRNAPKSSLLSAVPPELPWTHFRLNFPLASYGLPLQRQKQ